MKLKENEDFEYNDKLELTTKAHYTAVIEEDEYKVKELAEKDKDIKYIVDLGSNIGTAAYHFQHHFPDAKIIVCEPEPELLEYARKNTKDKLIYVQEACIGDDRKEVTFNLCKWEGNGHVDGNFRWDLFKPMGSEKVGELKVKACTLADLVNRYEFPTIDLLKVDTEGMEGQILTKFKPHLSMVKHIRGEWHGDVDRELIREALQDTHYIYMDRRLTTHGDLFAINKELSDKYTETIQKSGYKIIKMLGLPEKIQYD